MQELRWKLILIAALGAVFAFLAFTQPVNLGLDLRGGIYLELQVDVDEAVAATVQDDIEGIGRSLVDEGIAAPETAYTGINSATMSFTNEGDAARALEMLNEFYPNTYSSRRSGLDVSVTMDPLSEDAERDGAINQALQIIRNRVDQYGVAEPVIQRLGLGGTQILVQLPGVENPERIKSLLRNTALLELKLVQGGPMATRQMILDSFGGELPSGTEIVEMDPTEGTGFYLVDSVPLITGRDLKTAGLGQDELGLPAVSFTLSTEGSRKFSDATGANVGRQMAIVLDNRVRTAPTIEERISTPQAIIRGQYSVQEAQDLGLVLRSGALPASIQYLSERFVGPSLGQESIDQGVLAAVLGLAIVAAFMVLYYKGAGINALVALALNVIIVVGVMNALGAALTLPGIAGMILLIGMAVDANVLIFERIREELDLGKTVRSSVDAGFNKAFSAIIDANVTTLVAAIFLFQFGTGPVKGFAVTLSIGIMASMFTAIFVSRALFDLWILRRSQTLSI